MKKNIIKNILIILLVTTFFVVVSIEKSSLAMSIEDLSPKYTEDSFQIQTFGQEILGIITNIAVISSVVIAAFIGLKIMFGSVDQKAEYKKALLPLTIGVLVVLGTTTIVSMVWKLK